MTHAGLSDHFSGRRLAMRLPYEGLSRRAARDVWRTASLSIPARTWHGFGRYRTFLHGGPGADRLRRRSVRVFKAFSRMVAGGFYAPAGVGLRRQPHSSCGSAFHPPAAVCSRRATARPCAVQSSGQPSTICRRSSDSYKFPRESRIPTRRQNTYALAVAVAAHSGGEGGIEARLPCGLSERIEIARGFARRGAADLVGRAAVESAERAETTPEFAASLGLGRGVTGYVYHTVFRRAARLAAAPARRARQSLRSCVVVVTPSADGCHRRWESGKRGGRQRRDSYDWLDGLWEWPRTVA